LALVALPGHGQQAGAPPPTVLVTPAERRPITQGAEFIGRLEALGRVEIRARVTGFLRERTFVEGQKVNAGELLFLIEREPFEADVAAAQAKLEGAQATLTNANLQVTRGRDLVRTNNIPQSQLDQRIADAQLAAAQVSAAQAALQQARIQLGYTQIITPIGGRVGRATVTAGNVVGPDSGVLTTVVDDDPMRVLFPVTQRQLLRLRRDQAERGERPLHIRLRLPDGSWYEQAGRISFVDVRADASTDSTLVQGEVANPNRLLTDSQVIGVRVETEDPVEALVIPESALQIDQAGPFVLVVGEGNKVEERRIKLGPRQAGHAVVEDGLPPGTLVITEGAQRTRPGGIVAPRPAPPVLGIGGSAPRGG
jgi:membrane fusion protein (multidrug efflux system)